MTGVYIWTCPVCEDERVGLDEEAVESEAKAHMYDHGEQGEA